MKKWRKVERRLVSENRRLARDLRLERERNRGLREIATTLRTELNTAEIWLGKAMDELVQRGHS